MTSSWGGIRRARPYAFTEQGVAMLSSVLRSHRAMQVNVAIMRAFLGLRRVLASNEQLARKLSELERRLRGHDQSIVSILHTIRRLMMPPAKPGREIGFHAVPKGSTEPEVPRWGMESWISFESSDTMRRWLRFPKKSLS